MKLRLGGFLLILCILNTASALLDIISDKLADKLDRECRRQDRFRYSVDYPKIEDIFFELRTSCNKSQFLVSESNKLRDSPDFDVTKKTVVFVSGWRSDMDEDYTADLTQAYNCRGGHNFIVVNTVDYIKGVYVESALNTKYLGESIAMGLEKLNIPGENIHLIGHSLGAHIMGSAGSKFFELTKTKIGRITGLDPARPCFVKTPVFKRLGVEDATFVDVIHSNSHQAGTEEAIGHVDFFPGGLDRLQRSCKQILLDDIIECSHIMSIKYYTESVYKDNGDNFIGVQCESETSLKSMKCDGTKMSMGFAADGNARGLYVLQVNDVAPYGRNAKRSGRKLDTNCGKCEK